MIGAEGDSPRRAVLTLVGHVDLTTAPVLWERLVLEIGFGVNEIVVDMAGATFLDCVGLGVPSVPRRGFAAMAAVSCYGRPPLRLPASSG